MSPSDIFLSEKSRSGFLKMFKMPSREVTESEEADKFRFLESLYYGSRCKGKNDKTSSGLVGLAKNSKINTLSSAVMPFETVFVTFGSQKCQNQPLKITTCLLR